MQVQNGLFLLIGVCHLITRVRRWWLIINDKQKKGGTPEYRRNTVVRGAEDAASLSSTSRTETIPNGSEVELINNTEAV